MSEIGKTSKQAYKDQKLLVRLDSEERHSLEEIAMHWGMPLAGAVRRLIREEAEGRSFPTGQ